MGAGSKGNDLVTVVVEVSVGLWTGIGATTFVASTGFADNKGSTDATGTLVSFTGTVGGATDIACFTAAIVFVANSATPFIATAKPD